MLRLNSGKEGANLIKNGLKQRGSYCFCKAKTDVIGRIVLLWASCQKLEV